MILTGAQISARKLLQGIGDVAQQQQPCGIDLTLKSVSAWRSAATIDFDNSRRRAAKTDLLLFATNTNMISLPLGIYLVDFNETVRVPRGCMATIFSRSSPWRSGLRVDAGLVDAGYEGALGAMLEVKNDHGVELFRDARLAQIVFYQMTEEVEGYNGIYQFSDSSIGCDGIAMGQAGRRTL